MQTPICQRKTLLIIAVLLPAFGYGQFTNFPLTVTYTNASWAQINGDCHPIMQLYSATVERIDLINNGTATLAPLSMVNTYKLSAGTNATVVVDGSWTYTNWSLAYTNITLTNVFTNFEYQFVDASGSHSATGVPYYTVAMMSALDTAILSLIPYFVATNKGTGATLGSYLTNKFTTVEGSPLPMERKAGLFARNEIGAGYGYGTNAYGWTNSGTAYFTRGVDPQFNNELLGVSYNDTGVFPSGWQLSYMDAVDTNVFTGGEVPYESYSRPHTCGGYGGRRGYWIHDPDFYPVPEWSDASVSPSGSYLAELYKPVIRYQPAGTNAFANTQIEIWGEYITSVWQTASTPYVETVSMTSTNFQLTNTWVYVSNIVINGTAPNVNDSYVVLYTNRLNTYGARPYFPSAKDLDERYDVLQQLRYTQYGNSDFGWWSTDPFTFDSRHPNVSHIYAGRYLKANYPTFEDYPTWEECVLNASNYIEAATNWITLTNSTAQYMRTGVGWYTNVFGFVINIGDNVDSHPFVTNVYTKCSRKSYFYWADVTTDTDDYYNFSGGSGAPVYPDAFFNSANFITATTNSYEDTLLDFWRNPVTGLPYPTNPAGVIFERIQAQSAWFLLFDWSPGLNYK